ncbi:MAG: hypothetical protein V1736_04370 [Pseudomonadota bacterium]
MRKLAIVQIILGALIVGFLVYWMGSLSDGYHIWEGIAPDGNRIRIMPMLRPNPALNAWTILYPVLGLSVLGCGIAQYFKTGSRKLAIAQIALGVVITISLVWFIGWAEWDYVPSLRVMQPYGEVEMKLLPGWIVRLMVWKIVSFILSFVVIGVGVAQLGKVSPK